MAKQATGKQAIVTKLRKQGMRPKQAEAFATQAMKRKKKAGK